MRTILWFAMAASMVMFLVSGLQDPPSVELTIAACVVLTVVVVLFPFTGRSRRAFRGAPIGIGTVVSLRPTGLTAKDRPELEITLDVHTPDGHSFRGVARHLLDVTELGVVTPGATLPVRYRPDRDDGKVVLATDAPADELQRVYNLVQVARGHLDADGLRIAEHGLDARAVVLVMRPTGEIRGDRAVLELTLRVTRQDGSGFDVTTEKAVPPVFVPRVQPGSVITVKYLPGDETAVALALPLHQ
jgi:hypothetical protein